MAFWLRRLAFDIVGPGCKAETVDADSEYVSLWEALLMIRWDLFIFAW